MQNPITGRISGAAKSVSLRKENPTVAYGILLFCALHKILQRRAENVKPYSRTHTRTRQQRVFERVNFGRVVAFYMLFTRAQSAADADTSVTRTALSDSTPLT